MDMKKIVEKIKLFLNEEVEVSLVDVKTNEGIILSFEVLEPNAEIFVTDEAGRTPAPDGEYILEDGTKIVAMNGLIESVELPEAPVEDEVPVAEEAPVAEVNMSDEIELLRTQLTELQEDNKSIREILSELAENLSQKELKSEIKMSMTAEKEVEKKPFEVSKTKKLSNVERYLNSIQR